MMHGEHGPLTGCIECERILFEAAQQSPFDWKDYGEITLLAIIALCITAMIPIVAYSILS